MATLKYRVTGCEAGCDRAVGCPVAKAAEEYIGGTIYGARFPGIENGSTLTAHMMSPGVGTVSMEKRENDCIFRFSGYHRDGLSDWLLQGLSAAVKVPVQMGTGEIEPFQEPGEKSAQDLHRKP